MKGNGPEGVRGHPLWWITLSTMLLAGCVGGSGVRQAGLTPPDPPPLPVRKPWARAAQTLTVAPPKQPGAVVIARQSGTLVGYSVQSGDTVFGIGRRLSVPLRSIIDANALRPPYTLRTGQTLRIPNPRKHVVAKGDTVYGIARKYNVNLTELVRLNHVPAPFTIAPGQDLTLPVPMRVAARVAVAAPSRAVVAAAPPAASAGSKSLSPAAQTAALRPLPAPASPPSVAVSPRAPAAIPVPPPRSASTFLWPVRGQVVTSYGPGKGGLHNDGINIAVPRGTAVRAAENGVVAYVGNELRGFGNLVLVKHAGGWVTAYAHNEKLLVRRGDKVTRGQAIAQVGSSGNVVRPQLHFEIRKGARAVDPIKLLHRQNAGLAN